MYELKYIELKSGYRDNGPAWIGRVKLSQSGRTLYFNDHAFQKSREGKGWYFDVETGETYWIFGVKKDGHNRHWAGSGCDRIRIDRNCLEAYLSITGETEVDESRLEVVELPERYPVERIRKLLNERAEANGTDASE